MKLTDYFNVLLKDTVNLGQVKLDSLDSRVETVYKALKADEQIGHLILGKTPQEFGARLASDTIVVIRGRVNHRDDGVSLHANSLQLPDLGLPTDTGPLVLTLREARATVDVLSELDSVLGRHRGGTEVRLRLLREDTARVFELPHRVDPSAGFFGEVKSLLGPRALA